MSLAQPATEQAPPERDRWGPLPRHLHPWAWWVWALGLATAASRTTNPLLLLLVIAVAAYVVARRRGSSPWARAFPAYLVLGAVVVVIRVLLHVLVGYKFGDVVLLRLPVVPLPEWAAGIGLLGTVRLEGVLAAAFEGLRLATLLVCIGAANALANPKRALRSMPAALYEVGVAVVVAITVAPQLVESVLRVRRARRLRGAAQKGLRALRGIAIPVLEDALDRSLALAAAMDSRGYARRGSVSRPAARATAALMMAGLIGVSLGVYGLLDGSTPALLGVPTLVAGVVLAVGGLLLGGRRVQRTRYRPDPWAGPEWVVAGTGGAAAVVLVTLGGYDPYGLNPALQPLAWPALPLLPAAAILVALAPAWLAPRPPDAPTSPSRRRDDVHDHAQGRVIRRDGVHDHAQGRVIRRDDVHDHAQGRVVERAGAHHRGAQ